VCDDQLHRPLVPHVAGLQGPDYWKISRGRGDIRCCNLRGNICKGELWKREKERRSMKEKNLRKIKAKTEAKSEH
jgi:hypothetical protein